jgi:hypothetical protein
LGPTLHRDILNFVSFVCTTCNNIISVAVDTEKLGREEGFWLVGYKAPEKLFIYNMGSIQDDIKQSVVQDHDQLSVRDESYCSNGIKANVQARAGPFF